jgi:hypothetical protein
MNKPLERRIGPKEKENEEQSVKTPIPNYN